VVDAPHGLTVHADGPVLERALGNLVDNAVRYGEGTITLAARTAGHAVVLTVSDEGAGISAGFLAHAAERFRQDETSRTGPGAGLGLALVDAITTAHAGQLRICAAGHHHQRPTTTTHLAAIPCTHPAHGTTISLLLPDGGLTIPTASGRTDRRPPRVNIMFLSPGLARDEVIGVGQLEEAVGVAAVEVGLLVADVEQDVIALALDRRARARLEGDGALV
jgi:hypothetical protein